MTTVTDQAGAVPETVPATVTYMFDLHMTEVLNMNQRLNRFEQARRTAAIRSKAVGARLQDRQPKFERALLEPLIQFRDRRRRDALNYAPTIKAAVDGIVSGPAGAINWPHGLLPDDDTKHLTESPIGIGWVDSLRPYFVRLTLKFTELT